MRPFEHHPSAPVTDESGTVVAATDWLGNTFRLGEQVAYCIAAGHGQMMAIGEVVKIESETREGWDYELAAEGDEVAYVDTDRNLSYKRVPSDDVRVRVQVRTLRTSGSWNNEKRSKPAWVNPMNITALPLVGMP